ncbi:hypothetical protein TrST_g7288 [Triparma strigata]|uniref:Uncharacterized protein n=1 Tax=Triparma strigata TaxID=1606541 RepID=A0A9W7E6H9_9STRA|nr:hypothetical protein TrST_g7288 [Triparma strigata]
MHSLNESSVLSRLGEVDRFINNWEATHGSSMGDVHGLVGINPHNPWLGQGDMFSDGMSSDFDRPRSKTSPKKHRGSRAASNPNEYLDNGDHWGDESEILNDLNITADTIGDVMEGARSTLKPELNATLTQQLGNLMSLENEIRQNNKMWKLKLNSIRSELGNVGVMSVNYSPARSGGAGFADFLDPNSSQNAATNMSTSIAMENVKRSIEQSTDQKISEIVEGQRSMKDEIMRKIEEVAGAQVLQEAEARVHFERHGRRSTSGSIHSQRDSDNKTSHKASASKKTSHKAPTSPPHSPHHPRRHTHAGVGTLHTGHQDGHHTGHHKVPSPTHSHHSHHSGHFDDVYSGETRLKSKRRTQSAVSSISSGTRGKKLTKGTKGTKKSTKTRTRNSSTTVATTSATKPKKKSPKMPIPQTRSKPSVPKRSKKIYIVPFKSAAHHYESASFPWVGRELKKNSIAK